MKISKLFLTISFILFQGLLFAQRSSTVSGKVSDSDGAPLAGASVVVKGTVIGTQTDFDGYYRLDNVPNDALLVFTYIGYSSKTISVGSQTSIDVVLEEDAAALDEVV